MRVLVVLLCAVVSVGAVAQPRFEQARREGEVVWYTAMNVADAEAVLKPFRERYPFLETSILRAAGESVRRSILADAGENRFTWDVVSFNVLDVDALNRAGLLAVYRSPETRAGFPAGAVDPAGRWAAIYVRHYVLAYNTRLVNAGEAPRSWQDLLAARWKGRFALDDGDVEWYAAMLDYWGRAKGLAYMRALGRQKPQRRQGHQVLAQQLVAGDFALALVHANEVERAKQEGAPVEWVKTLDPTIGSPSQAAISAKAPHPAAARLLVDYLLSKEGQRAILGRGRVPARTDLGPNTVVRPLQIHYVDPRLAPQFADYEAEFHRVLSGAR
jgi:iron(III) transport system substrate-binding protein